MLAGDGSERERPLPLPVWDKKRKWFRYREKLIDTRRELHMKKYELTYNTHSRAGTMVYRIRALINIPEKGVRIGDLGGYVSGEHNLSHTGTAWIGGNAEVIGSATVREDALVEGNATISAGADIAGNAHVFGNATVYFATIKGNAQISGSASIYDRAKIYDNAQVSGNARVFNSARVFGNAQINVDDITKKIYGKVNIYGGSRIHGNAMVSGDTIIRGNADFGDNTRLYQGTIVNGESVDHSLNSTPMEQSHKNQSISR